MLEHDSDALLPFLRSSRSKSAVTSGGHADFRSEELAGEILDPLLLLHVLCHQFLWKGISPDHNHPCGRVYWKNPTCDRGASHHCKTMPDTLQRPAVCTVNEMKLTSITFLWTYLTSTSCHLLRWLSTRSSTLSSSCSALSSTRWHTSTHLMLMYRIMYCTQSRPKSPI